MTKRVVTPYKKSAVLGKVRATQERIRRMIASGVPENVRGELGEAESILSRVSDELMREGVGK